MGDQAERIVLEAEDMVTPVVSQANAGLDSFEKKAESSHGKVVRITDQTRTSVQRLISSLEKQAETYGKSGVDRLITQRDQLLQRYAKEPQAIDAITRSYEKMIAVEHQAAREAALAKAAKETEEALAKQTQAIRIFGDNVAGAMTNPVQGARGAVTSLLTTIGPFGVGIAAGATALVAFAAAGFEAAKSLGQYGVAIKDAELRTGLTAKEVGQFGFAAKAVGQDISIVERLMRGLSQAADDNSKDGDKARAAMQRMGIELHNTAGELKPTSEILTEISEALNKLPEGLQRDAAAMDLFKRVGIEAIPFMTELNENLRVAHEEGFGPTEEDVRRFQEYQQEVTVLETKLDALVRKFKEGLVITVSWVGKGVDWFLNNVGTAGDDERQHREEDQARQDAIDIARLGGVTQMSRAAHRREMADMEARAPGIMQNREATEQQIAGLRAQQEGLVGNFGWVQAIAPTEEELSRMKRAADIQKQIEQLQGTLDGAQRATRRTDLRGGKEEADRLRAQFFGTTEGMQKAYDDAKKDVEKYRKQLFDPESPLTKQEVTELAGKLHTAQGTESRMKASIDSQKTFAEAQKAFQRDARAFEARGEEAELDAVGKIYRARDLLLQQAAKVKASEAEIAAIRKVADEQAGKIRTAEATKFALEWSRFEEYAESDQAKRSMKMTASLGPSKDQMKDWEEWFHVQDQIDSINLESQKDVLNREAAHVQKVVSLSGAEGMDAVRETYQIRIDLAKQLAEVESERILKETNGAEQLVEGARAMKVLNKEIADAKEEATIKELEIQMQQMDSLKKQSEGLWNTLLMHPTKFPKELASTVHEAVIKPVAEGMASMTANILHPAIYGADGSGGLAGIFKGIFGGSKPADPVKISTDQNTTATILNTAHVAALTAVLAGAMGMTAPAVAAPAGIAGLAGVSVPSISVPARTSSDSLQVNQAVAQAFSGGGGAPAGGAASGGYSMSALANLPLNHQSPLFQMLAPGLSGSKQAFPGLSALESSVWNTKAYHGLPIDQTTGMGQLASGGLALATSPAATAAGMMLATGGLMGKQMGSWGGIGMGTVGGGLLGAGIGMQYGGPMGAVLGAGIGAIAGFGIGLGEKLAGIESPQVSEVQEIIPLIHIRVQEATVPDIWLSDRRVTLTDAAGGAVAAALGWAGSSQLYIPRLTGIGEPGSDVLISQDIKGSSDSVRFTFGNADRTMTDLANDTDLKYAEIDFCAYNVNSGILIQIWKGVIQSYASDGTPNFPVSCSDGFFQIMNQYPERQATVTDANHYRLTALVSGTSFTVAAGAATLIDLQTSQCTFNPATVTAYLTSCYLQAAGILSAAGLVPWLQLGEVGWWFFSRVNGLAIGYTSWSAPISIGTVSVHGLSTGQGVIDCGVQGDTAANGDFKITVTDTTHFTLTGSSGNGTYVSGTGTVSGGGMAYYDAYTAAAALAALGRALASFWTQDDDPSINSHADANFLRTQVYTHMHTIAQAVKAAYPTARMEWLLPLDTNSPTVYWNAGYPYPQGGRLNNYVNIPSQYMAPNGDIDRVKLEALSWGASYLNIDLAIAAMEYGSVLNYPKSAVAYLIPWFNGACAWAAQYLAALNAGIPLLCFWAVDHLVLLSQSLPLPVNKRRARLF